MANKAISSLAVGSSVYMNVGGVRTEFLVVHQGLPSSLYDSSCDGTWLLMKDAYEKRKWNSSSSNIYETSTINTYLNGTFLDLFDSAVQGVIKQVKIPYRKGGGSGGTNQSGVNGLSCKVFLLSAREAGSGNLTWTPSDGEKLDYFTSGDSSTANKLRKTYLSGTVTHWWLRSPYLEDSGSPLMINTSDIIGAGTAVDTYLSIRPALILPSTTLVDDSGNVVTVDLTAHKTLVNGTSYTVQDGKCMVDGTVYNILKGRTLIDGTAWDITFPEPPVMPVKGDLITMNLDGTDRLYRVLKVVDGTTVEVLGMWNVSTSIAFNSANTNTYAGKTLDTYLNTTWYGTLSSAAKNAIIAKNINQYQYSVGSYNKTTHSSYADYSTKSLKANVGERYVYALDIEDIEMYFGGTGDSADNRTPAIFSKTDLLQMFWNQTSTISEYPWLRSAGANESKRAWYVYGDDGYVTYGYTYRTFAVRAAFQIDLSKIDFTIN